MPFAFVLVFLPGISCLPACPARPIGAMSLCMYTFTCVYVFVFLPGISCHYLDCYVGTSFTNMHRILMGEKHIRPERWVLPSGICIEFCHEYLHEYAQNSVTNMIGIVMGEKTVSDIDKYQCETAHRGNYPIFANMG